MDSAVGTEAPGEGRRSAPELATLLLELARLVKARRYYGPGDARLVSVFERCVRSWLTNLERSGALAIEITPRGFREAGSRGVLSHERLAELHRDLGERGLCSVRFEPGLDAEAFAGFVEVLAAEPGTVVRNGGFSAMLEASVPFGIRVQEAPQAVAKPPPLPSTPALQPKPEPAPVLEPPRDAPTEPLMVASVKPAPKLQEWSEERRGRERPASDLSTLVHELGECDTAGRYSDLARRVATAAELAFENGDRASFDQVVRAFADHVEGKRDERVGEMAQTFLTSLACGKRLDHMIDQGAEDAEAGIHSMRALMLLGDEVVAGIVAMATHEQDHDRREALFTVVLALGDRALPPLFDLLRHESPVVLRAATRLAGDTQHPAAVHKLADTLHHPDPEVRDESARALVRIGGDEAIAALARGTRSANASMVSTAIQCLSATDSPRALPPLETLLERSIEAKDVDRAKEVIRALGRMTEPQAARPLAALLQRRSRKRWLRELKVTAITALGSVPGDEAVGALAQAAQFRDTQMRKAAQTALDRRAAALSVRS